MRELIIRHHGKYHWGIYEDGECRLICPGSMKGKDVIELVQKHYPEARIGVHAPDIGPHVAAECMRQGFGTTLWIKQKGKLH